MEIAVWGWAYMAVSVSMYRGEKVFISKLIDTKYDTIYNMCEVFVCQNGKSYCHVFCHCKKISDLMSYARFWKVMDIG